jgi:hypothetical protein
MPVEVIGAVIALLGVIISVGISYFTSQRQANVEIEKLRTELHQAFSVKLFEKRLENYPDLYQFLSDFKKAIDYEDITAERVCDLFDNIQKWDSKYSILFGSRPGKLLYAFRKELYNLTKLEIQALRAYFSDNTTRRDFIQRMVQIELALKTELGVYAYENPAEIRELRRFKTYQEVSEFAEQNIQRK